MADNEARESRELMVVDTTLRELDRYIGILKDDVARLNKHIEQAERYIEDVTHSYSLDKYRETHQTRL